MLNLIQISVLELARVHIIYTSQTVAMFSKEQLEHIISITYNVRQIKTVHSDCSIRERIVSVEQAY